ncbi:MAG: LytTR family DNA-binding domain-containing protein [Eudoraea sp.]
MYPKLNVLVVERSAKELQLINQLILNNRHLNLVASLTKAKSLNPFILRKQIDLIIIDIEHPLLDELQLSESILERISIILTSKDSGYALKAFDYGAIHFLLKPLDKERFNRAIYKALTLVNEHKTYASLKQIYVRSDLKDRLVTIDDILWIEAMGDYVRIITKKEKIIVLSTLKAIGQLLPTDQFLRTHRSYIVNLKKVDNIGISQVEIEHHKLPMSRNQKRLEELLAIDL